MNSDITRHSAAELAHALDSREVSSVEVVQAHLERIAAVDGEVHAYLHVDGEGALAAARAVDERRASGEELHVLAGAPHGYQHAAGSDVARRAARLQTSWVRHQISR